ncbi:MAG: M28 family peptidase [Paenarthrobacter ureafaciens]|uniref:M28 family peptidase n=1 Tax=Paenarthrobacter ureafaciens TaxID=37931 RepID=UPI001ACBACE5|nr:M28 family peptidase [Paenarthrobacter ureafaciens]MBN9130100.1 M28 family peptidase [Paenarthrobacter ureafaciens]
MHTTHHLLTRKKFRVLAAGAATSALLSVALTPPALAATATDTQALRDAVSAGAIVDHLEQLQAIAEANDGNRTAGSSGHEASAEYIESQLRAAGYTPQRQYFDYVKFNLTGEAFERLTPTPRTYTADEFAAMSYSGFGDVSGTVTAVDINLSGDRASTSGCEAADFAGFTAGNIALIQRGTCPFNTKAVNAQAAGASAVIIFNQGDADDRLDRVDGTLGAPTADNPEVTIPTVGTSFAVGEELAGLPGATARVMVTGDTEPIKTFNVLADTTGRTDRTVLVGAHLDSVAEGPGINDNGSGSATILETALQFSKLGITPENRVRFAWWSGEEDGLIGSDYYVAQLSKADLKNHALNLNFDMVASPNPVRFVYDGDGKQLGTAGPNGSAQIEKTFLDYFASQGLATEPTEFDGRSDYFGFIENGIPAGGLFTGAEEIKTAEQAAVYGGTAGVAYDPCYHQACDDIDNINTAVLEQMADAVAHATLTFAMTQSAVNGTANGKGGKLSMAFKGSKAVR